MTQKLILTKLKSNLGSNKKKFTRVALDQITSGLISEKCLKEQALHISLQILMPLTTSLHFYHLYIVVSNVQQLILFSRDIKIRQNESYQTLQWVGRQCSSFISLQTNQIFSTNLRVHHLTMTLRYTCQFLHTTNQISKHWLQNVPGFGLDVLWMSHNQRFFFTDYQDSLLLDFWNIQMAFPLQRWNCRPPDYQNYQVLNYMGKLTWKF